MGTHTHWLTISNVYLNGKNDQNQWRTCCFLVSRINPTPGVRPVFVRLRLEAHFEIQCEVSSFIRLPSNDCSSSLNVFDSSSYSVLFSLPIFAFASFQAFIQACSCFVMLTLIVIWIECVMGNGMWGGNDGGCWPRTLPLLNLVGCAIPWTVVAVPSCFCWTLPVLCEV